MDIEQALMETSTKPFVAIKDWNAQNFELPVKMSADQILTLFVHMTKRERLDILCEIINELQSDEFFDLKSFINRE